MMIRLLCFISKSNLTVNRSETGIFLVLYCDDIFSFFYRTIWSNCFITLSSIRHAAADIITASHLLQSASQSCFCCTNLESKSLQKHQTLFVYFSEGAIQTVRVISFTQLIRDACRQCASWNWIHLFHSAQLIYLRDMSKEF